MRFIRKNGRIIPIRDKSDKSNADRAAKIGVGAGISGGALALKSNSVVAKINKGIDYLEKKIDRPFKSARSDRLLNSAFKRKYSDAIKRAGRPLLRMTNDTKGSFYSPWQHSILVKGRNYGIALHELGHAEAKVKKALSHKLPDAMAEPFWKLGDKFKTGSFAKNTLYKMADFSQEIGIVGAESDAWRRAFKSKVPFPIKKQMIKSAAIGISAYAASPAVKITKIGALALGASLIYRGFKPKKSGGNK
jgi:hypothetical protein